MRSVWRGKRIGESLVLSAIESTSWTAHSHPLSVFQNIMKVLPTGRDCLMARMLDVRDEAKCPIFLDKMLRQDISDGSDKMGKFAWRMK